MIKQKFLLASTAAALSMGLLAGCGAATNDFDDSDFDANPVRYDPDGGTNLPRLNDDDPVPNNGTNGTIQMDTDNNYPLINDDYPMLDDERNGDRIRNQSTRANIRNIGNDERGGILRNGSSR